MSNFRVEKLTTGCVLVRRVSRSTDTFPCYFCWESGLWKFSASGVTCTKELAEALQPFTPKKMSAPRPALRIVDDRSKKGRTGDHDSVELAQVMGLLPWDPAVTNFKAGDDDRRAEYAQAMSLPPGHPAVDNALLSGF